MATPIRTVKDLKNKINSDVFAATRGEIDPSLDPFYNAISESLAKTLNSIDTAINDSYYQTFVQTATTEEALSLISFQKTNNRVQRKVAEVSNGEVLVIADTQVDLPVNTQFITSDGFIYNSTIFRSCVEQTIPIESLERVDNYAIATIPKHNLGNLMTLTFSGATPNSFNTSAEIQIIDENTIKYANEGNDEKATGSNIICKFFGARVPAQSAITGTSQNKDFNTSIEMSSNIPEITDSFVCYNGFIGGRDIETLQSWKARLKNYFDYPENLGNLYYLNTWVGQNTDANYCYHFNSEDNLYLYLTSVVAKINSDYSFTNFTNDELNAIKSKIILNNRFSLSGVSALQFTVQNPSFVNINVAINGLSPNSMAMKQAIEKKLREYIALLPIKFFLLTSQLSNDKIYNVVTSTRDSSGKVPTITSVVVSGASGLDSNTKKPILGTITYL